MIHLLIALTLPTVPISYCDPLDCLILDSCTLPSAECECALLSQLKCDSRRLYNSLDCQGKNRAIELSKCTCDKDGAVEQAAKEMVIRQWDEFPNQVEYEEEIEDQTGQSAYNRRFGY